MDYKNMSDSELAVVMENYINRVDHLKQLISNYIDGSDCGSMSEARIKEEYAQLKKEIRDDADYLYLKRNRDDRPI